MPPHKKPEPRIKTPYPGLKRSPGPGRGARAKRGAQSELNPAGDFRRRVGELCGWTCVVSGKVGDIPGWYDAHHCVPAQLIRHHAQAEPALLDYVYDPANGIWLQREVHMDHESHYQRILAKRIPDRVHEFAAFLDSMVKGEPFAAEIERSYR